MMTKTILCFGDSNTWGYVPVTGERYPRDLRWTGILARELGEGYAILEEGQNGRTTVWDDPLEGDKNGLRHLRVCLESHQPVDLVNLMLGTNDLKARFSLTAFDIAAGIEQLIKTIQQFDYAPNCPRPKILIAAPPPVRPAEFLAEMFQGAEQKSILLARHYAAVAEHYGCAFLDVGQHISIAPADGIHYTPESHQILGQAFAEQVRKILK